MRGEMIIVKSNSEIESETTESVMAYIERDLGSLPVSIVAGALMRVSVGLAKQAFGDQSGETAAKRALENIFTESKRRTLN